MKKTNNNERLEGLAARLRDNTDKPVIQKIVPQDEHRTAKSGKAVQFNMQIDEVLLDRLKIHSIVVKKSLKQLVAESIEMLLEGYNNEHKL